MKRIQKKLKGMSLLEVMVSMGIFSLMMVTIAGIFGSSISSSRSNRVIERNLENAQFVMNELAKELRTSTNVNMTFASGLLGTFASPAVQGNIRFYDYSQSKCIRYHTTVANGNTVINKTTANLLGAYSAATLAADCNTALSAATPQVMTTGHVVPLYTIVKSSDGKDPVTLITDTRNARAGRVTMVFVVKENSSATQSVTIQTTVSLRDYSQSGIVH